MIATARCHFDLFNASKQTANGILKIEVTIELEDRIKKTVESTLLPMRQNIPLYEYTLTRGAINTGGVSLTYRFSLPLEKFSAVEQSLKKCSQVVNGLGKPLVTPSSSYYWPCQIS